MARLSWPLVRRRPSIRVCLLNPFSGSVAERTLLADTGAAPQNSPFELILGESDAANFGTDFLGTCPIGGAYNGEFSVVSIQIELIEVGVKRPAHTLIVPDQQLPAGFDGLAAFRFLNSFSYGNFGDPNTFGLETL